MTKPVHSSKSDKFIKMTTSPVEKLVLSLAAPSIVIMLTTALHSMVNTYFVASLGTSQVAAVGIAFPLMTIIQAMGFFFGQGSGNFLARAMGAQDADSASRMASTGFVSGFIGTSIIAITGIIFLEPLVDILGATETIRPHAMEYIFFILLAAPWMVAATLMNLMLRFQGNAAIAMVGMLSGSILNIFLSPLFILVFRLGVKGAAIATMISQITSFVILYTFSCTRKDTIPIKIKNFSPSVKRYMEMFRGGLPSFIRQSLMSVATITINHFARGYGDSAIAAISIVQRISMMANSTILGFGQGFQPVCGFNYGAKLYSRVRKAYWFCVRSSAIVLTLVSLTLAWFAPEIIALFRDESEVIAIGTRGLRLNCIGLPFMAVLTMSNMMTQTMGKALEASIIATSRQGLFLIPFLFIFSPWLGLFGTQLATPAADLASLIVVIPITARVLKSISVPDGGNKNPEAASDVEKKNMGTV